MSTATWILGVIIAVLAALSAIFWEYAIRDVGNSQLTLNFLFKLILDKWFILAIGAAFIAAILSYVVLREMGILARRFFLSLGTIATILACILVPIERITLKEQIRMVLIITGVSLVEK